VAPLPLCVSTTATSDISPLSLHDALPISVQQAVNGHVGVVANSPFTASLVNFTAGMTALVIGWGVGLLIRGGPSGAPDNPVLYRSEERTSELQSRFDLVCRLLLEKKKHLV